MTSLARLHDCLLLDLDGTLFRGAEPVPGAVDALAAAHAPTFFVTNNASRSPAEVARHLHEMGFNARPEDVVTSAQGAARLLRTQLRAGAPVLVVGTEALAAELTNVGLRPVRLFADGPVAVVQGHSPHTGWPDLAEAALAIRNGALWVAANIDRTLPTERGLLPGNGAMVAALRAATDDAPQVAGKPEPTLLRSALSRGDFRTPLAIGDRLDTDIAGANAAELPSLLVLSGVSTARDAVHAPAGQRPTYIGLDLQSLHSNPDELKIGPQPAWRVEVNSDAITVTAADGDLHDDGLSVVRAVASAVWNANFDGQPFEIDAGDDAARGALERWSLLRRGTGLP
ncbi:HAD-IIA family hydrolase [Mycobacterium sp.]|jgi:HAD superfamily hydrolase (TIGR01450 family)|uniref:HAD-IIA family hydrolase n=1 Tax=Mycobacterium sp. TaxID=1785 RepID=UPI002D70FF70|nr:HAD-IIA family hydrolase [Mycobacterium sp.]HZA11109.1 HAD-IIA family hydrolase [Mycobacterium sp.]